MPNSSNNETSSQKTLLKNKILSLQKFCEENNISFDFKKYLKMNLTVTLFEKINATVNKLIELKKEEKKMLLNPSKPIRGKAQKNRIRIEKSQKKYIKDPPIFTKNSPHHPSAGLPSLGK